MKKTFSREYWFLAVSYTHLGGVHDVGCAVGDPLQVGENVHICLLYTSTPPCYTIYIAGLVLKWIKEEMGGLAAMKAYNEKKAGLLYDFLDSSKLFRGTVVKEDRSCLLYTSRCV